MPFVLVTIVAIGVATVLVFRARDGRWPWVEDLWSAHLVTSGLIALVVVGLLIQLVPYGRDHSNPPVLGEPEWDSPRTEELVRRACYDCHSNESNWPWYSNVAPISWLVYDHVVDGRDELNFSEWGHRRQDSDEIVESVVENEMPLWSYTLLHSEARLDDTEFDDLVAGLRATFGEGDGEEDDD
jgi:hypothetical protein